jgi:F-type H+-transporting ATPase subunit epsilon
VAEPFQFDLVAPERLLLSESVDQVVIPGSDGYFTVLKGHAPFMSTLKPGVVDVTRPGGEVMRIFVRGGFADVNPAGLTILAEEALPVAEVNATALADSVKNAEEDVADAKDPATKAAAETRLQQLREVQAALAPSR